MSNKQDIINNFEILVKYYKQENDIWRIRAYNNAIIALRNLPISDIRNINQVKKVPNIGKQSLAKINEYLETGQIEKVEEVKKLLVKEKQNNKNISQERMLGKFASILGAGEKTAEKWWNIGMRSFKDLEKNPQLLTHQQKIGLKYYDDLHKRIPREYIDTFQLMIRYILAKEIGIEGYKLVIAGSYRRGLSSSGDIELVGTSSSGDKVDRTNVALPTSTDISGILENNALPDELYLSFRFNAEGGNGDYSNFEVVLSNVFVTVTATNDLANEPIASQEFNAGIEKVYLGRDVLTEGFTAYSSVATLTDLDNPVAIHRQLLHSIINVADSDSDAKIENSGYKSVAELRDSTLTSPTSTHWKTRLALHEQEELESIMEQLQYEGCFFFQYSPQAQQASTIFKPIQNQAR